MPYSKELIEEVKKLYPLSPRMHELAEQGNEMLGRFLADGAPKEISIDEILVATSLDTLQKEAKLYKMKLNLYNKWREEDSIPK